MKDHYNPAPLTREELQRELDNSVPKSRLDAVQAELIEAKYKLREVQENAWGLIEEFQKKLDAMQVGQPPDLLEAAQHFISAYDSAPSYDRQMECGFAVLELRAAIAKATS